MRKYIINEKYAFTLAEVLITLVVIGVIAALTIPALITNIQDAQNKTAWKKAFATFSLATMRLTADNAGSLKGIFNNDNDVRDKLLPYLSSVKTCDKDTALGTNGCWNSQFYYLCGNAFDYWDLTGWSRMVLADGMLVAFDHRYTDCTDDRAAKDNGCAVVSVDVNGFKAPNIVGKDIFFSYITEDGSFDAFGKPGDDWTTGMDGCDLNVHSGAYGFTCATQYLRQ